MSSLLTLARPTRIEAQWELPRAPVEIADEVELYAREYGRHAALRFVPTVITSRDGLESGTWTVRFTLKDDDRRKLLEQEQRTDQPQAEVVWLHEPDAESITGYRPLDLDALGAAGVRAFLEKGNTWSNRGEFASIEDQRLTLKAVNAAMREQTRTAARENARARARDHRRRIEGSPLVQVTIDLSRAGSRHRSKAK